mmetsp:Transcript_6489/g.10091  ORF Transcript_6489/g.10091 Transcript_6489/m.10091 type:complete len:162 (-) Transcript_6489:127-612(-)
MAEEEEARTAIGSSMRDIELRQAARAESFQKFSAKLEEDLVKLQASLDRAVQAASSSPSNLQLPANAASSAATFISDFTRILEQRRRLTRTFEGDTSPWEEYYQRYRVLGIDDLKALWNETDFAREKPRMTAHHRQFNPERYALSKLILDAQVEKQKDFDD